MERVAALVEKLTTQLAENADKSQLKQTAVQLLAALSESDQFNNLPNNVSVMIPSTELQEKLALEPIKDLKSAIGINDKFQFIATLFGGDEKAFEQAVKTINGFKIYAEAQFWIKSNLREQNKWDDTDDVVKAFDLLVKRRFA
ncbi:MAG: hypothetical protein WCG90_07010 [Chitinophagia bacterium]